MFYHFPLLCSSFIIYIATDVLLDYYKLFLVYRSINFGYYRPDNIYSIPGQQSQL